jgi:hypothetical protein
MIDEDVLHLSSNIIEWRVSKVMNSVQKRHRYIPQQEIGFVLPGTYAYPQYALATAINAKLVVFHRLDAVAVHKLSPIL